ncbi:MAG: hydrolase [Sulfitobacter sp.]|nr:hydrolase [Sulfitobacter sp.]
MKIAVFQMSASPNPTSRLDRIESAMSAAAKEGADILVAPELAITGYGRGEILQTLAQSADGLWVERLKETAVKTGISLVAGFPERHDEACYISALIIDKNNPDVPRIYRKGYLYGTYEKDIFEPNGPSALVADLHGIKVGFLICYDVEFPENVRRLALAGAELVIVPTALPKGPSGAFIASHVIPVRAFENQVFLAYANHADRDERFEFQGMSSIAAPNGDVLASAAPVGDALIFAEINPEEYQQARLENPYLADVLNASD